MNPVKYQVVNKILNQIENPLPVLNSVQNRIIISAWGPVWGQVRNELWGHVQNNLKEHVER